MSDLEALRALSEAASPGEWTRVTVGSHDQKGAAAKAFLAVMAVQAPDNPDIEFSDLTWVDLPDGRHAAMVGNGPKQTENGDFIVAAVNYVRAALAADDPPSEGLTLERVYEAIRPEYRQPGPGGVDTIPSAEVRARDAAQRIYQRLLTDPSHG